ncbi:minor tail protein [Microbacterium phage Blett]|nr:minor tail protein [Microbacterium phage Blett]
MRLFKIESPGGSMMLDGSTGVQMRLGVRGMGMPPVALQWFDGAGEGSSFRGGKVLARTLDLPLKITGRNRNEVLDAYSTLAKIMRLPYEPTLTATFDDDRYRLAVVRTGGGDFDMSVDSDGKTVLLTTITVQAGRPYWESIDSEGRNIEPAGVGLGLLGPGQSLVQLILGSIDGFGSVTFSNTGDVEAWPTWTIFAPFSGFALVRADGLALEWVGASTKASGFIIVDSLNGTVVDETGANRYGELKPAPKFFSIQPGTSQASVVLSNAASGSRANVAWRPRKMVLF